MFTGLVQHLSPVVAFEREGPGARLTLSAEGLAERVTIGDSVAINGCCLTVVQIEGDSWSFEAGSETLSRTNLGELTAGSQVNVECSLRVGDPLGGHYVTGHVDAVGRVARREDDGAWTTLWFATPREQLTQMASKGSVAVDGVSLTLVEVTDAEFSVALIPHTLERTTLGSRRAGDRVNIETDVLAKYIQRQIEAYRK